MASAQLQRLLDDTRVLVCRPEPAATELGQALSAVGAHVEILPTINIEAIPVDAQTKSLILDLDHFDHVVVLSPHAAALAMEHIDTYWPQFPAQQQWHAIGRKTARILTDTGLGLATPKGDLTSEELLKQPAFKQLKDKKVLLLKGAGGRDVIAKSLERRGASVAALELYRRIPAHYSTKQLKHALIDFAPEFIVTLSAETLQNLLALAEQVDAKLQRSALIVPSHRVMNIALEHGFKLIYTPDNLMPIDIIRTLRRAKSERPASI